MYIECLKYRSNKSNKSLRLKLRYKTRAKIKNTTTNHHYGYADDDRIVSHDASGLGLYYHCVRDVIIYSTLSR